MKDYIELNSFLKSKDVASTGGQAKLLIRAGKVKVNGEIETRNKKKLCDGDKVEYQGECFIVSILG
jgi:ribosome-associated protein